MMVNVIDVILLSLMVITAFGVVRATNLFGIVMLLGIFSLLSAALYVNLDAVDVAFTEAAVGAGISTVLLLGTLALTGREEAREGSRAQIMPLAVVFVTGTALIYGTFDMPRFGDAKAPIHNHVTPRYLDKSDEEVGPPNIVTSILASYRGFDTLGEVTVVFTAGVGVMTLLGQGWFSRRRKSKHFDDGLEGDD
jgi:multicomponent Na+:H+ antiporter subunit B